MSLLFLSLYKKLQLPDLKPTSTLIQLADCSIRQPVGILEDLLVQVGKFVIPCDFFVMDMDENSQVPLILGRPFLATAGALIDVQANTLSFQLCGERVDLCFSPSTQPPVPVLSSPSEAPLHIAPFDAVFGAGVLEQNGQPHTFLGSSSTFSGSISTHFGPTSAYTGKVRDPTSHLYPSPSPPTTPSPSTIWR